MPPGRWYFEGKTSKRHCKVSPSEMLCPLQPSQRHADSLSTAQSAACRAPNKIYHKSWRRQEEPDWKQQF